MAKSAKGSIRRQLPGLIGLVLTVGVVAFGAVAYEEVRLTAMSAANARLHDVAGQFATIFGNQYAGYLDSARAAASDPAVVTALEDPAAVTAPGVRAALARLGPVGNAVHTVEVRSLAGSVVATLGDSSRITTRAPGPAGGPPTAAHVGGLYVVNDTALLEVVAPVVRDGEVIGHVVQGRRLLSSPEAVRTITELIGADAALLLGNADGSVWTDLVRVVDRPPSGARAVYSRDGVERHAVSQAITGTPLQVAVEFPRSSVLAVPRDVLWTFAGLAALIVAVGTLAGRVLSRRITGPLTELAEAAGAISAGDLTARVAAPSSHDEIGRLTGAFNVMTESVRTAHDTLEEQVAVRTAELEESLRTVHALQDELVRKERLATLGQLSSGVGHELRNPLGVMTNAVYYLDRTLEDAPPKVTEYLGILRGQIATCDKIVSDLLDFARVKPPQTSRVRVADLVEDQLARVSVPPEVRVERRFPDGLPSVEVDPGQVGQVLLNLITNGLQAMEESGGVLTLGAQARDGVVHLEVADTGPGVPGEIREQIFEPLFTTKARGIGLGLSVSRSLARANGGELRLADPRGLGAVFVIELPSGGAGA